MSTKTIAMKLLENRKIPFEAVTYPISERDAEKLAILFGVDPAIVFKTLVVPRDGRKKPLLVMIPADRQLNLKKLAKAMGEKKLKMASHKEAERLTGLQVGGISPLALLNKGFAVVVDDSAELLPHIYISAGQKGINLKVPVPAIIDLTKATVHAVT